ncbi:MAG: gliding motility-associated C-terminal domain-containing protein [Bacteroidota bacterium]|nr:gliding motility-associated C-terminal domain-containing protein [Bacteroidota bacterium]
MNSNYYSFKKLLFIGIFTFLVNSLFSQVPANDNPCSATALTVSGTCTYVNSTNLNATASAGVPAPGCASYTGADVWFSAVVGSAGNLTVQTNQAAGGFADAGMAIYSGACGSLTLVSCDDDGGTGNHSLLNVANPGLAGQTVYIRVWRYNSTTGGAFQICATSCDTKPANNACTTATAIVANTPLVGTNVCASTGADDPTIGQICALTIENTVWYAFTPVQTGSYTTIISGYSCSSVETGLQVGIVTGACPGPYTAVNCTSGDGPGNVTFTATAGTTYYIVIDGNAGAQCNWTLNIQSNCSYSNISCATAASIPGLTGSNSQVCLNNICNTGAPDNSGNTSFSSCGDVSGPTLWYQITTDAGDQLLNLSAVGTGFSPHIQLWSACGTYMSGYCNVASGSTATLNSVPVTGSTTYYVSVSPASGIGSGTFNLCAQSYPNPCPTLSGNCAAPSAFGAIAASTTVCKAAQCNIGAPITYAATPTSCGTFQGGQVWYSVTTPATGDFLQVSVSNSTLTDPMIQIWSSCGTMLTGACVSGTGGTATLNFDCVPSTSYTISITSASGVNTGTFDLCVNSYPDLTACNISDTLYVLSAVPAADGNGNYLPNTLVTFRYTINKYRHINLNFLQGVVPGFGGAWDLTTLTPTSTPLKQANNEANSIWSFMPAGSVDYNNVSPGKYPAGTLLGAGWFFKSRNNAFGTTSAGGIAALDPDDSWGDGCTSQTQSGYTAVGCAASGGTWQGAGNCLFGCMTDPVDGFNFTWTFEFSIRTKAAYDCNSPENFRVSVETFADGEIGNWDQVGCTVDQPFVRAQTAPSPAPILAAVTSVNPVCNGNSNGSITVVGSGGYSTLSYQLNAGAFGASGNFTGLAAGTYTITIRDMILCTRTVTVTLTDPAIPTGPVATSNSPVCVGSTINLFSTTGPGITNVSWTGPSAFSSALQNPTRGPATAAMAGTYSVSSLFNGCPTTTSTVAVVVNANPTAGITPNPASVCAGVNLTLNGNPAGGAGAYSTHTWTGAGSGSLSNVNIVNPVFNNSTASTYALTYTVIDDNGCTGASNLTVTVNALPVATASNNGPVCAGQSLTLTGGPAAMTTYAWSGPNTYSSGSQSPTVSATATAAMAGTYTLVVTNGSGCQNTATTAVTVNALPSATASNNGPVCAGQALNLTGGTNGMTSYTWSGPSAYANGTQSPTVSATATAGMAGTYTLTISNGTCSNTATTAVTVNTLPSATASANTPCVGAALNLTGGANGMTSYTWSGPSAYASGTQSPTVSASATAGMAGTYTLTVSNGTCTNTATVAVTVNTLPIATASSNTPCVGSPLTLTGGNNGMTSYSWSGPNTYASASQSPTVSATATAGMAGTYTLTISNGTCSNTATVAVTVNALPNATASSNTPCVGAPLNLTGGANGMTSYSWSGPGAYANGTQSPTVSATATAGMAGTYTLTVSNGTCTNTAVTTVTVTALPNATASANTPCVGAPLNLTGGANGMTSYTWSGPSAYASGTQSPTVSATATAGMAGTYTLTISNGTCSNTATVAVTVNALPSATASSNTPCVGTPLNLTGGTNGMTSYTWSGPSSYGSGTQSPTVSASATAGMAGTYTLTVSNGTCSNTATVAVTVNALPTATAASNSPVCIGNPLTLTGGNNGMTSYTWSGPSAYANGTQSPTVSATATAGMAGTYTVTIIDGNGCQRTATTAVTINTLPSAVGTSTAVCAGSLVPAMNFTTTPATGVTVDWTNSNTAIGLAASGGFTSTGNSNITGYTAPVVGAQEVGVISVIATNTSTGCVSVSAPAATYTINPLPVITQTATVNDPTSCGGADGSLTGFTATGSGAIGYSWNTAPVQNTQNAIGLNASTFSVTATDGNGCAVSASYSLTDPTSPAPPAFTFTPSSLCVGGSATFTVTTPVGGQTYNWTGPSGSLGTGNSITINPVTLADAGVYNVFTTAAGCTGSTNPAAAATLVVNANPSAAISSIATSFCQQSNIVLDGTGSNPGGTATITGYQWYDGSGILVGQTGSTLTVTTPGTYSLMVTNSNTCSNTSAGYPVTFFSEPVMDTTGAVNSSSACTAPFTGSITGITVSGGIADYIYTWTGASGVISTLTTASTNALDLTGVPAGSYTLTIEDFNGCNDTSLAFTINNIGAPSSPLVTANNSNCAGSPMSPITVDDVVNTINWYSDAGLTTFVGTGNPFTPVTTTTHTLYVTSTGAGCSSAATTVTVTVNPKPAAPASLGSSYCAGQTINDLTVTSAITGTVTWYSDLALTTPVGTGTPFASGVSNTVVGTTTFYVAETALGCLGDYTQVDVTVNANPLIDTTNMVIDTASCDGSADGGLTLINVTGTGPLTYTWSDATGVVSTSGSTPDLTPFPTGTYTLVVTDGNTPACSATLSNLVINAFNQPPVPVLNVSSDLLYCDGETVTALTATSSDPIFWYSDATLTTQVGSGTSFTPIGLSTDTTFYAIANNGGCLSTPLAVAIDFHAVPVVPIVNGATYCRGDVIADLVSSSTTINWFADNMTTVNIGSGSPFNISGLTNTATIWYADSISYTGITCGSDTGSVTITINNLPVLDITTSLVVDSASCGATSSDGSITGATVTGTPGFTYTWSNATGVVSTSTTSADLLNQAAGSYTLMVTDGNTPACSVTSSAITINTYTNPVTPVFVTSSDTVYCAGETITALQASSSSGTLIWYSDATLLTQIGTGSPFTPSGITSSTTIYLVANNNSCNSDSVPVSITFNSLPSISANSPSVCAGGQVTLAGTNASGNATTYSWNNGVVDGVAFTPVASGSYIVTGTDGVTQCVNTFTTNVTVNNLPTVSATVGSTTAVCSGGTITLTGTGASTYSWNNGVVDGVAFTPTGNGSYIVTGTDANNCVNTFTVNVSVNNPPTVATGVTATIPCGSTSYVVTGASSSSTNATYTWAGPLITAGGSTLSPTIGAPGQYTLTVVDNITLCSETATLDVTSDVVVAGFTQDVTSGFSPLAVNFTNQSTGALTYAWNFGDGNASTATDPSNVFTGNGTYTVTLTAASNGCTATATVTIIVSENSSIVIPNIFSPNGDGLNDELTIQSTGLKDLSINIFNRWGQQVYVIDRPGQNWDGLLSNGEQAAEGTYFYLLKATGYDAKTYEAQGPVMLVK